MSKTRFFYAPAVHRTWPKIFVLTEDGELYCEYLEYSRPKKFISNVDFIEFKSGDFKWSGYQRIIEVKKHEAVNAKLTNQNNWVLKYLEEKV